MSETRANVDRSNSARFRTTGGPELLREPARSLSAPSRELELEQEDVKPPSRRHHSVPVPKSTTANYAQSRPGAVAVRGVGSSSSSQEDVWTTSNTSTSAAQARGLSISSFGAVLVNEDEQEQRVAERLRKEREDMPWAMTLAKKPFYKRQVYVLAVCVILLAVIIVSITVPISNQNQANTAALSPTVSPAPTSLALITVVLQLDRKPWETGWTLECDDGIIEKAGPGTYGIVSDRPVFRIEYEAVVTAGADCRLTIEDIGGDGMNPGLYEVYYGKRIGDQESLLISGTTKGSEISMVFTVENATSMTPVSPTSSPTRIPSSGEQNTTAGCIICPDGSRVLYPEAMDENGTTCEQFETLALTLTGMADCKALRDTAQPLCGCRNYCTKMCPDGTSDIDPANADDIVFIRNNRQVTCSDFQEDITSSFSNSMDQCTSASFFGEEICGCDKMGPFCNLCEGGLNPPPEALEKQIVPGVSCRDLTGIAYCLRQDDPTGIFARLCPAFLSIGAYCGCDQPPRDVQYCRLCGDNTAILPEPARLVNSTILGIRTSCFHVEFVSNMNDTNTKECDAYRRENAPECCD